MKIHYITADKPNTATINRHGIKVYGMDYLEYKNDQYDMPEQGKRRK